MRSTIPCQYRDSNPTANPPTVPTAERMFEPVLSQSSTKVWRRASGQVVLDPHPHRAVHQQDAHSCAPHPGTSLDSPLGVGSLSSGQAVNTTENS